MIWILNPYFITGFSDAESSFVCSIRKNNNIKIGWRITLSFQIQLHKQDLPLLNQIQAFFGVGKIYESKEKILYQVRSVQDLINVIIPHFNKYPLISQKRADFELFKLVVELVNSGEHLTSEGLTKILALKASMNNGLSKSLKESFPGIIPVERPKINGS